jgi:hypothetical protein
MLQPVTLASGVCREYPFKTRRYVRWEQYQSASTGQIEALNNLLGARCYWGKVGEYCPALNI